MGGSGGGRGLRSGVFTTLPPLPTGTLSQSRVEGVPSLAVKLQGRLVKHPDSQSPPQYLPQGLLSLQDRAPRLPAVDPPLFWILPSPGESAHRTMSPLGPAPLPVQHPHSRRPRLPLTGPLLTTVLLISPIPAVVRAVALAPDPQADAVVLATEGPVWRAHEPGCSRERRQVRISLGGGPRATRVRQNPAPAPTEAPPTPGAPPLPKPRPDPGASPHSSGFSSELSPQSSSPSHFHASGLHRVLLHWNSSRGQVRTGRQGEQRVKNEP